MLQRPGFRHKHSGECVCVAGGGGGGGGSTVVQRPLLAAMRVSETVQISQHELCCCLLRWYQSTAVGPEKEFCLVLCDTVVYTG